MLAVMEASQNAGPSKDKDTPPTPETAAGSAGAGEQEFLLSGRTGRRNALPDILGQHATVTSSDLPSRLQNLTTKDKAEEKQDEPSTSSKR